MKSDKSDNDLMKEFSNCSKDSYIIIFNRYKNRILNFIIRGYIHDKDDAEDVVQKTFIKVYTYKYKYKSTFQFSTWIYTIAKNLSLNEVNRIKRFNTSKEESDSLETISENNSPASIMENKDYNTILKTAIEKLKPKYKEVIALRYIEGFSYSEISGITSKGINTLKSHCRRGLQQIKEMLSKYGFEKEDI